MDNKGTHKRWEEHGNIVFIAIAIVTTIALIIFAFWYAQHAFANIFDSDRVYKQFKTDTTVIEGQVNERHIQNDNGKKQRYLLIAYKDDNSKIVNVNENQFNTYDKGSKVKFRIDRRKDNKVVVDLKKHKDINSKEDFEEYNKDENGSLLEE